MKNYGRCYVNACHVLKWLMGSARCRYLTASIPQCVYPYDTHVPGTCFSTCVLVLFRSSTPETVKALPCDHGICADRADGLTPLAAIGDSIQTGGNGRK